MPHTGNHTDSQSQRVPICTFRTSGVESKWPGVVDAQSRVVAVGVFCWAPSKKVVGSLWLSHNFEFENLILSKKTRNFFFPQNFELRKFRVKNYSLKLMMACVCCGADYSLAQLQLLQLFALSLLACSTVCPAAAAAANCFAAHFTKRVITSWFHLRYSRVWNDLSAVWMVERFLCDHKRKILDRN